MFPICCVNASYAAFPVKISMHVLIHHERFSELEKFNNVSHISLTMPRHLDLCKGLWIHFTTIMVLGQQGLHCYGEISFNK